MEKKSKILIIGGIVTTILYIIFSKSISETQTIWTLTRIFGMVAFFSLAIAIILGELRLLHIMKADFTLFKFHTPMAIFALFIALLHGISALMDEFKWGIGVPWTSYMGFSFSNKWLLFLSLGTLAFYAMLIVGVSSATKVIQTIGYKKWKLIHYLSYLAFFIAFYHSVNLGTDLKNDLATYFSPIFLGVFLIILSLLVVRIIKSYFEFEKQSHITIYSIIMFVLVLLLVSIIVLFIAQQQEIAQLKEKSNILDSQITIQENIIATTANDINILINTSAKGGAIP